MAVSSARVPARTGGHAAGTRADCLVRLARGSGYAISVAPWRWLGTFEAGISKARDGVSVPMLSP
jgi:hypothetical protein